MYYVHTSGVTFGPYRFKLKAMYVAWALSNKYPYPPSVINTEEDWNEHN